MYRRYMNDSFKLSIVYTLGHILIAGGTIYALTGANLWESGLVALVEPCLNGVWFYILHRLWRKFHAH